MAGKPFLQRDAIPRELLYTTNEINSNIVKNAENGKSYVLASSLDFKHLRQNCFLIYPVGKGHILLCLFFWACDHLQLFYVNEKGRVPKHPFLLGKIHSSRRLLAIN
jgi:hypothetical protein